jgi:transposase
MGLVVDQDGILITHTVHPGNTADVKTVDSMNKRLQNTFGIDNSIMVVDRGMISTRNVKQLDINMQSYVFALKLQNQEKDIIDALRENLKSIDDNTSLAEVMLVDNSRRKKYVVGHSKDIAKLSAEGFEAKLKRVEEKLQKIKSDIDSGKHKFTERRIKNISCMLKTEKVSKFILPEFNDIGFTFHRLDETIKKAKKYDGFFLLSTTEIDLKGEDILNLDSVKNFFKSLIFRH